MEEEPGISAIELTPIETISKNNSAVFFNDEIRSSSCKETRYPRQISKHSNDLTIKPNQVGIDVPANDWKEKDLNEKFQENVQSIWDFEKTWHEKNALAREKVFESILQNDDTKFSMS